MDTEWMGGYWIDGQMGGYWMDGWIEWLDR